MSQPNYQIINILFLESSFKRVRQFQEGTDIVVSLDVQKGVAFFEDNGKQMVQIELTVTALGRIEQEEIYTCMAMTTGIFSCEGGTEQTNEIFANINGPAIIYPFIREYMANLAMKGGITLFLPPVNFIKMHQDEKAQKITDNQ